MINKKYAFRTDILILLISFLKQLCIISYIYIYIYVVYSFYEDNNLILVILVCAPEKIDVAKSVKKLFKYDHSMEITIFVCNVQNMNFLRVFIT